MEIIIGNKLKKKCLNRDSIIKNYGSMAGRVIRIIDTIGASQNLHEVSKINSYKFHQLAGNYEGCYAISINGNYRMVVSPCNIDKPYELKNIKELEIVDILDYH